MPQQSETGQTFHSFTDLGISFDIAPTPSPPTFDFESFMRLPIRKQLWLAYQSNRDKNLNARMVKQIATRTALETTPHEKARQRIRSIAYVPLNKQGQMVAADIFNYQVYTVFPYFQYSHFLSVSRLALQSAFGRGEEGISSDLLMAIDELVGREAELRPETLYDRYDRLIQEVKMTDTLIKEQKNFTRYQRTDIKKPYDVEDVIAVRVSTAIMDQLNDAKHAHILAYLKTADDLFAVSPHLPPLYALTDAFDTKHRTLQMHVPYESSIQQRLLDPTIPVTLIDGKFMLETTINIGYARQKRDSFPSSKLPEDQVAFEMCEMLGW